VALAGKYLDEEPYRVWVLCGDSEMAEGSMWEAFQHASFYKLDNLIAILDMNRLGQTRETMDGWNGDHYSARARAFGWHAIEIDGHDPEAIDGAYEEALGNDGPTLIVAKTKKGYGVSFLEDVDGMHGKPVTADREAEALESSAAPTTCAWTSTSRTARPPRAAAPRATSSYRPGSSATRRRPAARTGRPSRPSAPPAGTSWRSTAR
jgi:transketolase